MLLAPLLRTLCFALVSAGVLQFALEALFWRLAPRLSASANLGHARGTERRLFALTLAARVLPWLLTLCLLVPAYLRGEDNAAAERVGLLCLIAAASVALWIAFTLVRGAQTLFRTGRYCRTCHATGRSIEGHPVLAHRGSSSLLAVAGIFRSRLLVSESLLDDVQDRASLSVAFRHEAAHAHHRDNLKLLLLTLAPTLPFAASSRPSLESRWRLAAELAADEDSTQGDAQRSLQLANLLVSLARQRSTPAPLALATLLSAPEHLTLRVERLITQATKRSSPAEPIPTMRLRQLALAAAVLATLICLCAAFGHRLAELLLHLG